LRNNQRIEKRKDAEIIKGKWKGKKRGEAKKPWVCCMKKDQGHAMKERDTKKDQGKTENAEKGQQKRLRATGLWLAACDSQAFKATLLFDPSMSALPIILKQNSVSIGLFTH